MFGTYGRRTVAAAGIALMFAAGAGACGGGDEKVDKAAFAKKLKAETGLKAESGKYFDCLVDISLKYGDKGRINDYVSGKKDFDDANIIDSHDVAEKANKEMNSCVK